MCTLIQHYSLQITVPHKKILLTHQQIDGFDTIAETQDLLFLSTAAAA